MTTSPASDETPGSAQPSAIVIPFPARPVPPQPTVEQSQVAESDPQIRLARALESLEAALATQRAAVATWRAVLGELKTTTATLEGSLQRYRSSLQSLGTSVSTLHEKARALEDWADKAAQSQN